MDHLADLVIILAAFFSTVGAVGREGTNFDDERMAWVVARWFSRSFQGTCLSPLNLGAQYSCFITVLFLDYPGPTSFLHQLPSQATYIHLPDIRDHAHTRHRKLATPAEGTSHLSSHCIHLLIYITAQFNFAFQLNSGL